MDKVSITMIQYLLPDFAEAPINSALWNATMGVTDDLFTEMIGWQDLTKQVTEIYQSIPDSEKPYTVILAGNYGEAGALDLYGDEHNLRRIISGGNSYWYRSYGGFEPETVVGVESLYAGNFSLPANIAIR